MRPQRRAHYVRHRYSVSCPVLSSAFPSAAPLLCSAHLPLHPLLATRCTVVSLAERDSLFFHAVFWSFFVAAGLPLPVPLARPAILRLRSPPRSQTEQHGQQIRAHLPLPRSRSSTSAVERLAIPLPPRRTPHRDDAIARAPVVGPATTSCVHPTLSLPTYTRVRRVCAWPPVWVSAEPVHVYADMHRRTRTRARASNSLLSRKIKANR